MTNKKNTAHHIAHAHDRFFKMLMADKRVAKEFFEAHLPADIRSLVDLNKLELEPGSYIDDYRQETIADTLFKVDVQGQPAYLYIIVDHQSTPDVLMPFRVLKYTCNIISKELKETVSERIPLILPFVVYHGKQNWSYSTDINDLVDAPRKLVEDYFLKPFCLIDLNKIDNETIKQRIWAGAMELTLKHIFAKDMQPFIYDIIQLVKEIEKGNGKSLAEIVLTYILDKGELSNKDTFFSLVKTELSPEVGDKIMTIAEQLKAEGLEKGLQQGLEQGLKRVVVNLLENGSDLAFIAKTTGLSLEEIKRLKDKAKH